VNSILCVRNYSGGAVLRHRRQ